MEERKESKNDNKRKFQCKNRKRGGRWLTREEEEKKEEKSKNSNKKIDRERRKLLEFIENRRWEIFNENIEGDKKGEFTYTKGRGNTVIDYIIGERETKERIKEMRVGDMVESDYHSLEIRIREKRREGREEGKERVVEKGGKEYGTKKKKKNLGKRWGTRKGCMRED